MASFNALIVGAGSMGRAWGQNLDANADVTIGGWVDLRPGVAAQAAHDLGVTMYTDTDLERALREVCPDFVVDVSSPEAHHRVTLTALAAGVPVLGEKPMAESMEQAREMVAAAERTGKLYMVSQSRRYDPRIQAYRQLIADRLGLLGILNSDFYIDAHFGGFRDEMSSPLLLDMAIHTFDAARYISGTDPVAVYCEEFNPGWSWYRGDACATAIFEMSNGLRYTYRGSWCSAGQHTSWEADWRAVGAQGTAVWNGHAAPVADVIVAQGGFHVQTEQHQAIVDEARPKGIAGALEEFLAALTDGITPMGECHDNIKSLAMVFGAIESARTKQRISIHV